LKQERTTRSGIPLKPVYGPEDIPERWHQVMTEAPGGGSFLRGAYPEMYRSKPWRIFQLSGYGSPEEMAARLRYLLEQGETGFIMKRDRVTNDHLYDVDHPEVLARVEDVGQTGAVLLSARDVEIALEGVPIERSYAHPGAGVVQAGPFCLTSYWVAAKRKGHDFRKLSGTGQSDFFLTYVGCPTKEQIPPQAGLRLNCDLIEFCSENMPRWVPVSIAGYNGADSGLNACQELGAVMANAIEYLDEIKRRGRLDISEVARGIGGVNFRTSMAFVEDVSKLRAARKMWHDLLTDRYGVTDPRALRLRIHVVTAGSAMAYQQPMNNVVRGTLMALVAALGGAQSLGVSGYDEAISIPSDHAHQMSIRTQQILQEEFEGLVEVADPVGGSYMFESVSASLEEKAWEFVEEIEGQGGFIEAIDGGWLHQHASEGQLDEMMAIDSGEQKIIGVNCFQDDSYPYEIDGFTGGGDAWEQGMKRLASLRHARSEKVALSATKSLEQACLSDVNIVPAMLDALDADCSIGEIGLVYRSVFGDWKSPIVV
jgi:methylmalonyl-CoA mutase N-terminal domain/subunit